MAAADFAFAASAGAAALALSTLVWTWRLRARARTEVEGLRAERDAARLAAAEAESAAAVFDGALIAVEGDDARLVLGEEALADCARLLKLGRVEPAAVLEALAGLSPEHALRLKALIRDGAPCRFTVAVEGGALAVEGRAAGAVAWVRVGPAAEAPASGRFADLAERLPHPAWIVDGGGRLVWANRAWLAAAEAQSVEDARARDLDFDRGARALAAEAFRLKSRREGFRWVTVDGRRRAYAVAAEPADEDEVCAFALDVTEAEETREHLGRVVAAHDETLNHLADAVAIFGPEKRLAFRNTAFERLWGLDASWLDERPTHAELLDRLRQRRRLPESADYPKWKARELDFYGATTVAPDDLWSLPDGRTLRVVRQPHPMGGLLVLFADITDELKLKAQYNALIQVQQATLDKLNDAVAVFGSDGRLRLHNEAFERFWGLTREAIEDAGGFDEIAALCRPLLHDPALWRELKARVGDPDPQARVPVSGEAKRADGRVAAYQSRPLPDGATLIAFDDVTATRALERALEERSKALEEAERLKRDFVGNVSYELRTPLTTISGYAELLESLGEALPERARGWLGSIRAAAGQLTRSIDDVLDMAQIDAGEMALSLGDVRVAEALAEAAERVRDQVAERGGVLVIDHPEDAGLIRADARRLTQALTHLLENAARATPQGGTVTLSARRVGREVRLSVRDEGRGIPFHVQAHVFDRFVGRDRGGPGLGLALVRSLVELHGGWVAVESEPGKGATFSIHLPESAAAGAGEPELALS